MNRKSAPTWMCWDYDITSRATNQTPFFFIQEINRSIAHPQFTKTVVRKITSKKYWSLHKKTIICDEGSFLVYSNKLRVIITKAFVKILVVYTFFIKNYVNAYKKRLQKKIFISMSSLEILYLTFWVSLINQLKIKQLRICHGTHSQGPNEVLFPKCGVQANYA